MFKLIFSIVLLYVALTGKYQPRKRKRGKTFWGGCSARDD